MNTAHYKNLVFSGGVVRVIAHVGALEAAINDGLDLNSICKVAGTSSGSLLALLVACGFEINQIKDIILNQFQYTDLLTDPEILTGLFRHEGIFRLDHLQKFIEKILAEKFGEENSRISFLKLKEITGKSLHVATCRLFHDAEKGQPNTGKVIFSPEAWGDTAIVDAVLASCSFPLFFQPTRLVKKYDTKYEIDSYSRLPVSLFVDGGVLDNYPLTVFDQQPDLESKEVETNVIEYPFCDKNNDTLGFVLLSRTLENATFNSATVMNSAPVNTLGEYLSAVAGTLFSTQMQTTQLSPSDSSRSVFIDTENVNAFNFWLKDKDKATLISSGQAGWQDFRNRIQDAQQSAASIAKNRYVLLPQPPQGQSNAASEAVSHTTHCRLF